MEGGAENWPTDCWRSVFNHLNEDDFKAVSLACKNFLAESNLFKETLKVVNPKISMLSQYLKRFRQLKKIDLSDFQGDIDEALREIAHSDLSLEALDITCRKAAFKTESLRELGSNPKMNNLKALNCFQRYQPHDNYLLAIANLFPNLEELNIIDRYPASQVADHGVEFLATKLKFLKKIYIFGRGMVSDQTLITLSVNCDFLKEVIITGSNPEVTENGIGLLLRNRPNLETLSFGYIGNDHGQSTITLENSISHAKALTSLELYSMYNTDKLFMAIVNAKLQLNNLGVIGCKNFTVSGLLMVLTNISLTKLRIVGVNIVDVDMELLLYGDVEKVTHIEISQCRVTTSTLFLLSNKCPSLVEIRMDSTELKGDDNIPLSKNHKIQNLCLQDCRITDELAEQIGFIFPNLRVLDLSFSYRVTSIGIEAILKSCKCLRELILKAYCGGKKIIDTNSELPEVNLKVLTLSNSKIDDEGLAVIEKKCPQLVNLDLTSCKNVTTEIIKHIVQNIKTLTCLNVSFCKHVNSSDLLEWMLSTSNLASLKKIFLRGTDFTKEQIDQFLHHGCLLLRRLYVKLLQPEGELQAVENTVEGASESDGMDILFTWRNNPLRDIIY